MRSRVSRWGNSLAIRIPASFSREIKIADGDTVDVQIEDGHLLVTPIRRAFTLDELVAGITEENRHDEIDWGAPVGGEVW